MYSHSPIIVSFSIVSYESLKYLCAWIIKSINPSPVRSIRATWVVISSLKKNINLFLPPPVHLEVRKIFLIFFCCRGYHHPYFPNTPLWRRKHTIMSWKTFSWRDAMNHNTPYSLTSRMLYTTNAFSAGCIICLPGLN